MANIEAMLKWMTDRQDKVTYSMASRLGPNSYDCSSAVYFALQAGGFLPSGTMGNTDTLFNHLEASGWQKVALNSKGYYDVKRGDIFIWGTRGASGGASGHTGIFVNANDQIIHCNYGYNGITVNDHDTIWGYNGKPAVTIYRYGNGGGNGSSVTDTSSNNKPVETPKGDWLAESATFYPKPTINIRTGASTTASIIGQVTTGQAIKYDAYKVDANGYVWIRQPRSNGYGYLATGTTANSKRNGPIWGTFK